MKRLFLILATLFVCLFGAAQSSAATRYVAQTAGTFTGGTACNAQTAITPATFNALTLAPGDLTWVCGTITGAANANILTVSQNGTSGSPIVIQFDTGAILRAPYCSGTNGCLDIHGRSWITVNGEAAGTIENTANGDGLANQQISILIDASPCSNCVVENFAGLADVYVAIKNFSTPLGGAMTQMNAVTISGQNVTVAGNTIHDCGWCILDFYGSGDTNHQIFNNNIYNWDHAVAFATSGANTCSAPCLLLHDNQFGSNINFETSGCVYHLDGLHTFGTTGSTMNGIYAYNNYFTGSLSGACSSGFIFMEQGSSTPSHARNTYVWNNVFDASAADGINPNGWVGLFSGEAGVTQAFSNTLFCPSSTDGGTVGWSIQQQGANTTFENNAENKCPQGNNVNKGSGTLTMDYNAYGNPCNGTSNCWVYGASPVFEGSFSAWKTACGCDAHSFTTASDAAMLLNANGSPQAGSPVIEQGANLTSTATGNLATLDSDTTLGGTRAATVRPTGTCTTQGTPPCWDEGAFEYVASGGGGGSPLTYNLPSCIVSTGAGTCGSIPATLPYSPIFIPSTSTTTQVLPAAGVPFYELDYPTLTPYTSPCGTLAFVCAERMFDQNTWNVGLAGLPGGNPCPGASTYTGVPGSNTPSGSDVLMFSLVSAGHYTATMLTNPGSACMVMTDINLATGALTNLRVPAGITGGGEIHADYNIPSTWYGCLTPTKCYDVTGLNSATMATTLIADLSNPAIANLPLSVTAPNVVGGAGWETNASNGLICGQLGPQDNAALAVCVNINIPCAVWWRSDTGDMGGGSCWPGGAPTCTGCAQFSPLQNTLTFTGAGVTGNGSTASGTVSGTPQWGPNFLSIQGCPDFTQSQLTGVVISGTTVSWNSTFVGTQTGCIIGQQLGFHGGGPCQDGIETSWSLPGLGTAVWVPGTLTTWNASSINNQGHRVCGYHTVVAGPSDPFPNFWSLMDASVVNAPRTSGAGKLPTDADGHYFWGANPSETNTMYWQNYCASYSAVPACPSANANCPGCGEMGALQPSVGGKTYRAFQTRKNICANAPVLANCIGASTAYFYDEVSGQCSYDGLLCYFSTNWSDVNTGVPTLGSVTQGSISVYRNDVILVFMPASGATAQPIAPAKNMFVLNFK